MPDRDDCYPIREVTQYPLRWLYGVSTDDCVPGSLVPVHLELSGRHARSELHLNTEY